MSSETNTNESVQENRKRNLLELVDVYHRDKHGDYSDTYDEFATRYGLSEPLPDDGCPHCNGNVQETPHAATCPWDGDGCYQPIPRYASLRNDETYGMIEVFENLQEALDDQLAGLGEEYLNNPCGVIDLDTVSDNIEADGRIQYRTFTLPESLAALLPAIFSDAYEYRHEDVADTDEEDLQDDYDQAQKYLEVAKFLKIEVS